MYSVQMKSQSNSRSPRPSVLSSSRVSLLIQAPRDFECYDEIIHARPSRTFRESPRRNVLALHLFNQRSPVSTELGRFHSELSDRLHRAQAGASRRRRHPLDFPNSARSRWRLPRHVSPATPCCLVTNASLCIIRGPTIPRVT